MAPSCRSVRWLPLCSPSSGMRLSWYRIANRLGATWCANWMRQAFRLAPAARFPGCTLAHEPPGRHNVTRGALFLASSNTGARSQAPTRTADGSPAAPHSARSGRWPTGISGASGAALLNLTRFHQTKDQRFLRLVEQQADKLPARKACRKPRSTCGLGPAGRRSRLCWRWLAQRKGWPGTNRSGTALSLRDLADLSIKVFQKNGLFRADGCARTL